MSASLFETLGVAPALGRAFTRDDVVRSFLNLRRINLGFVPADVVMLSVTPRNPRPDINLWMAEFLRRVEALPDVDAAGVVYLRPLALGPIGQEAGLILEGQPPTMETTRRNPALNYERTASSSC